MKFLLPGQPDMMSTILWSVSQNGVGGKKIPLDWKKRNQLTKNPTEEGEQNPTVLPHPPCYSLPPPFLSLDVGRPLFTLFSWGVSQYPMHNS